MSHNHKYLKYKTKNLKLLYKLKGGMWPCPACTYLNKDKDLQCDVCSTKKPVASVTLPEKWNCHGCTFENNPQYSKCKICETPRPKPFVSATSKTSRQSLDVPTPTLVGGKTFYIYTTGLGCWSDPILTQYWDSTIRENILKNIDESFTKIVFEHYDPFIDIDEPTKEKFRKENIDKCEFIDKFIDLDKINTLNKDNMHPHLLIDFAHILNYLPNKETITSNSYGEKKSIKYNHINSLYFGFLGDPIPRHIATLKLFDMDSNGKITTYIDKLIRLGYVMCDDINPLTDPIKIIKNIIIIVKRDLEQILKAKGKSPVLIDDLNIENTSDYYKDAINMIMIQNKSPKELQDFLYNMIEPLVNK